MLLRLSSPSSAEQSAPCGRLPLTDVKKEEEDEEEEDEDEKEEAEEEAEEKKKKQKTKKKKKKEKKKKKRHKYDCKQYQSRLANLLTAVRMAANLAVVLVNGDVTTTVPAI